jgi:16S rRNA (guanine966-N2)-methyltransferase
MTPPTVPPNQYVDAVRVVGGLARGRKIQAPSGTSTRPTSDYVREAVFNVLGSRGGVDGAHVLDLFAGSGAMGIEALSRGAASATFVENDAKAVAVIRANLDHLGLVADATVVRADAPGWLVTAGRFDLAFVDPPYAFDRWTDLLERLDSELAVLESDRAPDLGDHWGKVREKRYGTTVVTLVENLRRVHG